MSDAPLPPPARLAGFVMALLGVFTYGTTSPFGLMLSAEKLWERDRPRNLRGQDWAGMILSVPGTWFLPFFLYSMWHYTLMGPVPVTLYVAFLLGWTWHRVRVVWGWPAALARAVEADDPDADF